MLPLWLWGGLQPMPTQVLADAVSLLGMTWATWKMIVGRGSGTQQTNRSLDLTSSKILIGTWIWTVKMSRGSVTNRWTLTFPMLVFTAIHVVHRLLSTHTRVPNKSTKSESNHVNGSAVTSSSPSSLHRCTIAMLAILAALCIVAAAALSVLFPALRLPPIDGPYRVGAVDFYLPLDFDAFTLESLVDAAPIAETCNADDKDDVASSSSCLAASGPTKKPYLPARLMYPTLDKPSLWDWGIPYLNPTTTLAFCRHSMLYAAPPPLKRLDWILHTWRLMTVPMIRSIPPPPPLTVDAAIDTTSPKTTTMPLVVYSHGLGGTLDLYSYQTMMLAAHGSMVLTLTHTDGTAPVVPQPDANDALAHNGDVMALWVQNRTIDYVRARRLQTNHRSREFLAATRFLHRLIGESNIGGVGSDRTSYSSELSTPTSHHELRFILRGIHVNHTTFMGHSHGGATVLTAANREPTLVDAIVAHEPAIDWAPDDCRQAMFLDPRLSGLAMEYDGGTGKFEENSTIDENRIAGSIHDKDVLVINSAQWEEKGWGSVAKFEVMFGSGRGGRPGGPSRHLVIANMTHNEFSDTSMLTPLWLARPTALAGPRNPTETAAEVAAHTQSFIEDARRGPQ